MDENNNPNQPAPAQSPVVTEPVGSMPETGVPPSPVVVPPASPKKSSKTILIIMLLLGLVILGGLLYWFVFRSDNQSPADSSQSQAQQSEDATDDQSDTPKEGLRSLDLLAGSLVASVQFPEDWKVEEGTYSESGAKHMTIYSAGGNRLYMGDVSDGGVGGDCGPDVTYTLVKRLATNTTGANFSEYRYTDSGEYTGLWLEQVRTGGEYDKHNALKEGETNTGGCYLPGGYSFYDNGKNTISFHVSKSDFDPSDSNEGVDPKSFVTYEDASKDPEFLAMLTSLKVTEK